MNITPVSFASKNIYSAQRTPSFKGDYEDWGPQENRKQEPNDIPKTNLKDFVGTAKQYVKPFLAGVVLTFAAQTIYNNNEKDAIRRQVYTERASSNVATKAMLESISKDIKDVEKIDSVEFKNVMGRFSKELIIYKDGKRIIYDADEKARYEDLGGDNYARTRFGVVLE